MTGTKHPSRSKRSKSNRSSAKRREPAVLSPTILQYHGPILLPKSLNQEHVVAVNFSYYYPLNATVGGVIDNVYGNALVASASDWAAISTTFHEVRVLAFQMRYVPLISYTTNYPPFVAVVDRSTASTLGSYAQAATHESCQIWASRYDHLVKASMSGVEESSWYPTASLTSDYYIKQFATGFTASQNVGNILFTFLVQFRGRA